MYKKVKNDLLVLLAPVAVIAMWAWFAVGNINSWNESTISLAREVVTAANKWEATSGKVLSITTLPGETVYGKHRTVQSWYANAEVAVGDDTVIVRLPDDALVVEGYALPLWYSTETGETLATKPEIFAQLENAQATLKEGPSLMPYFIVGLISLLLCIGTLSVLLLFTRNWIVKVWSTKGFYLGFLNSLAIRRYY
jgi:hypothetical protein